MPSFGLPGGSMLRNILLGVGLLFSFITLCCEASSISWLNGNNFGHGWKAAASWSLTVSIISMLAIAAMFYFFRPSAGEKSAMPELIAVVGLLIFWLVDVIVKTAVGRRSGCKGWGGRCHAYRAGTAFTWLTFLDIVALAGLSILYFMRGNNTPAPV